MRPKACATMLRCSAFPEASSTAFYWLSKEWILRSMQAQYRPVGAFELFGNDSLTPGEVMVSYFSSAYPRRGMGGPVSAPCSRCLSVSEIPDSLGLYRGPSDVSSHSWVFPAVAKGPSSISTIDGCSAWHLSPKLSVPSSHGLDLTSSHPPLHIRLLS